MEEIIVKFSITYKLKTLNAHAPISTYDDDEVEKIDEDVEVALIKH